MAQDELGHARSTYPVLAKLGVERSEEPGLDAGHPLLVISSRAARLGVVHRRQSGRRRRADDVRGDARGTARSSRSPSARARSSRRRARTGCTRRRGRGGSCAAGGDDLALLRRRIDEMWAQAARWPGPDSDPGYARGARSRHGRFGSFGDPGAACATGSAHGSPASHSTSRRTGRIGTRSAADDLPVLRLGRRRARVAVGRADHHEPDALPGVQHVLRSDPGGVRRRPGRVRAFMDDQLRRRSVGAPAARSLLLTILGEYVLPRGEAVWQETLVGALVSVGYTQQAARQALARSVRDGWLETSRHGRRARVSLERRDGGAAAGPGPSGSTRSGRRGSWDGRWLVLVLRVPEERREVRHQLRTRLAWAGLGSMGGGVWLTPHVEREAELREAIREAPAAEATSFVASLGALGRRSRTWPRPPGISTRCARRTRRSSRISRRSGPRRREAFFRMQTLLVHAWRKFPFLDPDLPAELLPDGWPRRRAHELFSGRHERWQGGGAVVLRGARGRPVHARGASGLTRRRRLGRNPVYVVVSSQAHVAHHSHPPDRRARAARHPG